MRNKIFLIFALLVLVLCGCEKNSGILENIDNIGDVDEPHDIEDSVEPNATRLSILKEDEQLKNEAVLTENGGFEYFQADSIHGEKAYKVLGRKSGDTKEILLRTRENSDDDRHFSFEYAENSFEGSGGQMLYFTLVSSEGEGYLYCFVNDTEMTAPVLGPCSNMAVPRSFPEGERALGYVLYEDMMVPVYLDDGSVYEGGIASFKDTKGFEPIDGSFFENDDGNIKYSRLSWEKQGVFKIITTVNEEKFEFLYDYDSRKVLD